MDDIERVCGAFGRNVVSGEEAGGDATEGEQLFRLREGSAEGGSD